MTSAVGTTLGPYRVVSPLGRGGMGETYLGERVAPAGLVQRVCLKRMRVDARDPSWVRMFQAEARLVAMLSHPNVVSLVDFGVEGEGEWWMALGLVEGVDLATLLADVRRANERLPIELVVMIATEIARGLAHAHSRRFADGTHAGIVHRDLSPGNVMVSVDGAVQITDFGIAKVAHAERTRTGVLKGKAQYMSPEQVGAEPLDARADLFVLGVVMFQMLTGTRPFTGATDIATQLNVMGGKRARIHDLAPDAPAVLVGIVDRLLQPAREHRYVDARALIDELGRFHVRPSLAFSLGDLVQRALGERVAGQEPMTAIDLPATRPR